MNINLDFIKGGPTGYIIVACLKYFRLIGFSAFYLGLDATMEFDNSRLINTSFMSLRLHQIAIVNDQFNQQQ